MIDFRPMTRWEAEYYEGEFDRVLTLEDRQAMCILQRAAKSRISLRKEQGNEPFSDDRGLLSFPADLPEVVMNPAWVGEYRELLDHYAHVGFLQDGGRDAATVDFYRFQARVLASELVVASEAFDTAGTLDTGVFFQTGDAA